MKRFQSRFESLQRLREQQEKMASLAMMQAIATENAFAQQFQQRQSAHANAVDEVRNLFNEDMLSVHLSAARCHVLTAEQSATNALEALQLAQKDKAAATDVRMQAYQRLQSVNKAAEKEVIEYRKQVQAEALVNRIDNIRVQSPPTATDRSPRTGTPQKGQS